MLFDEYTYRIPLEYCDEYLSLKEKAFRVPALTYLTKTIESFKFGGGSESILENYAFVIDTSPDLFATQSRFSSFLESEQKKAAGIFKVISHKQPESEELKDIFQTPNSYF